MNRFIKTADEETAKQLEAEGFDLLSHSNGVWTFINNGKMTFDGSGKIVMTNKLEV